MIDLHSHTTESDGTLTPNQLVEAASRIHLEALAITDHDTFTGFDRALPTAQEAGLDLICGIELSTSYRERSVHLLGYFLDQQPTQEFRSWIVGLQVGRHARNQKLIDKLREHGFDITLEEVRQRGRGLPGRPHFASILLEKGYVQTIQQAFDDYLAESGSCFVPRDEPSLEEGIARMLSGGGLPSLPHPTRVARDYETLGGFIREMQGFGLKAIEVYHSDHSPEDREFLQSLAQSLGLGASGGSDFHGETKPKVALGTGIGGNVNVPRSVLDELRSFA